jgi:glycosyltransferase involved in cell wall biosynthesis
MPSISVIIPTYNEGERILSVVNTIVQSKIAKEVIIVNDGSFEESRSQLAKIHDATIIELKENQGKSNALKIGFENSSGDIIVFVDADLKNFTAEHLKILINKIKDGYDMVLGERGKEFLLFRIIGMSTALTGERAFTRKILEDNIEIFESKGYLIESKINSIFFRKYKVGKIIMDGVGQYYKIQKYGLKGWFDDLNWLFNYLKQVGIKEMVYQLTTARFKIKLLN